MKMRFSTFQRDFGPVKPACNAPLQEWNAAVADGRFMTVYHGESDWCTPVLGMVRHHGCVNTLCKLMFAKPLPPHITEIIGMRDNDDALHLCNPS